MRRRLAALNAEDGFGLKAERGPGARLAAGIGIATGSALVGNMGLESRFDYSCIGDTVNTASRVESGCKDTSYDVLVTGPVRQAAAELAFLYGGALSMKGKSHREPVFLLIGDGTVARSAEFAALTAAHEAAVALLQEGRSAAGVVAQCVELAPAVEPGLLVFYEAMAARLEDFAPGVTR
jgi:adenylate cyclase